MCADEGDFPAMADQVVTSGGDDGLGQLIAEGVSLWLDGICHEVIASGQLTRLIRDTYVRGVTSNMETFNDAVAGDRHYGDRLAGLASQNASAEVATRSLFAYDIRRACAELHQVFEKTSGLDGHVSMDLDPEATRDAASTVREATRISTVVARANLLVKIRVTDEGIISIRECLGRGFGVHASDIFSVRRYGEVLDAYFDGLEHAVAAGLRPSAIAVVTSVPVGRIDAEVDAWLDTRGAEPASLLRGRLGLATARQMYQLYEERLGCERWRVLAAAGARPPRLMWTATAVSDPTCPAMWYVDEFVAWATVNTMSLSTLDAAARNCAPHGDTLTNEFEAATTVQNGLERLGISVEELEQRLEVTNTLRQVEIWQALKARVADQLRNAGPPSD
jgi:transaldolase